MNIHCTKKKQIKKGLYRLNADGIVEVQGFKYHVKAGTIVAPSESYLIIADANGRNYIWKYVEHKSEWQLKTNRTSLILRQFDGVFADVILIEKDDIGKCEKTAKTVRYINLFLDLPKKLMNLRAA